MSLTVCSAVRVRELAKQELGHFPAPPDRLLSSAIEEAAARERVIAGFSDIVASRKAFCLPLVLASTPMRLHLG